MNINQTKTKIFILKTIDRLLLVALVAAAFYTALYAENKEFMILLCIIGVFIFNMLGNFISKRIAILHVQLEMMIRDQKKEQQRTLMSTRHTNISKTRTTTTSATKTNDTTKK